MELRQHIGVFLLLAVVWYVVYILSKDWEKGYSSCVPLYAALFFWVLFEMFYWIVALLLL